MVFRLALLRPKAQIAPLHCPSFVLLVTPFRMARKDLCTLYFMVVMLAFASAARLQPSLKITPVFEEPQSGCLPTQVSTINNPISHEEAIATTTQPVLHQGTSIVSCKPPPEPL
jgi:hypothetical protein